MRVRLNNEKVKLTKRQEPIVMEKIVMEKIDDRFKGPARYRIVVGKHLSKTWSDRIGGMEVTPILLQSYQRKITKLEGVIVDQAQLSGILNTLSDFGFPLISVQVIEKEEL